MWPREKACRNIRQRVRAVARSFPSNGRVDVVIQKLNPVLNGWCTYSGLGTVTGPSIKWTGRFDGNDRATARSRWRMVAAGLLT